jgi:hypothetical protein
MIASTSPVFKTPIDDLVSRLSLPLTALCPLDEDRWVDVAVTAIALGLAPLLHWHLASTSEAVPPLALAKLAVTRQAHAKRNEAIGRQLAEVLAACAQHKLAVIVLKGALLAPTVYPEVSLRPMNDIDLLFQPAELGQVGAMLEGLGYQGKHKTADQGPGVVKHLSTYRRAGETGSTPNPYLSAGGERMIEPHASLEESWFGLKVDITPGVWERGVPLTLHGQPANRLSTSDLVIHLAVHATFHVIMGAAVFVQLYDLGQVIRGHSDTLNWPELVRLTKVAQAERFVYASLYWASIIFKAPVPTTTLTELRAECPPTLVAYIHAFDAATIFKRTQHPPLVTLAQRLRRGLQERQETARWAGSVAGKWKVWQTALAFHKTDTINLLQKRLKQLT